jgi:hypothetical protein
VSLADGWYTGSGLLSYFVRMQGTHGGLHRRAGETFAMSTSFELPSPIGLEELSLIIRRQHGWQPGRRGPTDERTEKNGHRLATGLLDVVKCAGRAFVRPGGTSWVR